MRKKNDNIKTPDCQHCKHLEECFPWCGVEKTFDCTYV